MIKESDSDYEEDSYDASDDENYIPAANGGTGTTEYSDIEQEMIIEQEEEYHSDEAFRISLCLKTSAACG